VKFYQKIKEKDCYACNTMASMFIKENNNKTNLDSMLYLGMLENKHWTNVIRSCWKTNIELSNKLNFDLQILERNM
jgi:hypothetical protein